VQPPLPTYRAEPAPLWGGAVPAGDAVVTAAHLTRRLRRLERFICGLRREAAFIRTVPCPLQYLECRAYLDALRATVRGLESASVAPAGSLQRHRGAWPGQAPTITPG
jgi:hypothetical protein